MRIHATTAAVGTAVLLAATLAGCGNNPGPAPTPTAPPPCSAPPTPTTPTSCSAPTPGKAETVKRCVDAVASLTPNPGTGKVPSGPTPKACKPLSDSDYLDAYTKGLRQSGQDARDELQRRIDEGITQGAQ